MPAAHPQKSFVDVSGGGVGLTLINKGLPQYEVKDDEARTIALTLLRAVGGGVRGPEQQVEGQLLGEHVFEFALYPHEGDWEEAESFRHAHAFNTPLAVGQAPVKSGDLPLSASLVNVNSPSFVLSAVKQAESGDALLVRGFNIGTNKQSVKIAMIGGAEGELVDLKEDHTAPLKLKGDTFSFESGPKKIISCKIGRARR